MRKNQTCKMTDEALENYGQEWVEVELIVTHVAHSYMPAKQFFAMGKPEGYRNLYRIFTQYRRQRFVCKA